MLWKPAESEIDDRPEIEILKDKADPNQCETGTEDLGLGVTKFLDDGDYFDEVVLEHGIMKMGLQKQMCCQMA